MIKKINGHLFFYYGCPKNKNKKNKPNRLKTYSLLIILMGIFLFPNFAFYSSVTPEEIIELTNMEREKVDVKSLTANQLLAKAAYDKANAIINTQKFQHNIGDKKFSEWIKDAGYEYSYVGENLAIDFLTSEGIIQAWKKSEFHNKNLLNPRFTEIGIAIVEGIFNGENTIVVVQIFGEPTESKLEGQISGVEEILSSDKKISTGKNNLTVNYIKSDNNLPFIMTYAGKNILPSINNKLIINNGEQGLAYYPTKSIVKLRNINPINFNYLIYMINAIFIILSLSFFIYINTYYLKFLKNTFRYNLAVK